MTAPTPESLARAREALERQLESTREHGSLTWSEADWMLDAHGDTILAALDAAGQAVAAEREACAKVAEEFCPPGGYDERFADGRAAMCAGDDIAAAIRALREALVRKNMAIRVLAEESRSYIAWSKQMPFERAIDDAEAESTDMAALSRAPGSDEALREMLTWAVSEGARAGEEGARTGRSETNESIVSHILGPEGGKA